MTPGPFLLVPEVTLPEETDPYTLQVLKGIKELQELIPTIKDCKTTDEVNYIRRNCQLIQTYAQKKSMDKELVQWAARVSLHCAHKIGQILEGMKARKELRGRGRPTPPKNPINIGISLKDLDMTTEEASNARTVATVTETELDSLVNENIARTGRVSEQAIVKSIRRKIHPFRASKKKTASVKIDQYWTAAKNKLEIFTIEELEQLPPAWEKRFAEYLAQRKANLVKVNSAFARHPQQSNNNSET